MQTNANTLKGTIFILLFTFVLFYSFVLILCLLKGLKNKKIKETESYKKIKNLVYNIN